MGKIVYNSLILTLTLLASALLSKSFFPKRAFRPGF